MSSNAFLRTRIATRENFSLTFDVIRADVSRNIPKAFLVSFLSLRGWARVGVWQSPECRWIEKKETGWLQLRGFFVKSATKVLHKQKKKVGTKLALHRGPVPVTWQLSDKKHQRWRQTTWMKWRRRRRFWPMQQDNFLVAFTKPWAKFVVRFSIGYDLLLAVTEDAARREECMT